MISPDREVYETYKSLKVEVSFANRIFIVYQPSGLTRDKQHRPPEILTQLKVLGFRANSKDGAEVDIEDLQTHEVMTLDYIPKRLFGFEVFASVAPRQRLQWDGTIIGGVTRRSLSFMIMFKCRSRDDYYSAGATSVVTPAKFRELFPHVSLDLLSC
jgi:hypothetical protein